MNLVLCFGPNLWVEAYVLDLDQAEQYLKYLRNVDYVQSLKYKQCWECWEIHKNTKHHKNKERKEENILRGDNKYFKCHSNLQCCRIRLIILGEQNQLK